MPDVDVAIIGAGIAGLACALHLAEAGVGCTLLEASDSVGGRVRTEVVDDFIIDRGFQVFLTAYPEASDLLDYDVLDLRPFITGADVFTSGRFHRVSDPRRRPIEGLRSAFRPFTKASDLPKLLRLALGWTPERLEIESVPDVPAEQYLRDIGLSPSIIDSFFRPFFGGVFFDRELQTSARMLAFCFSMFGAGSASVPAKGMQRIPEHLAAQLPAGALYLESPVGAIERGRIHLETGSSIGARVVIVATDSTAAARLLDLDDIDPGWRSTVTQWFVAPEPPVEEAILMLDGEGRGPVNHLAVLSNASSLYAPDMRGLVAANVVDQSPPPTEELERQIRARLTTWFGDAVQGWRPLREHRIDRALPDQRVTGGRSVLHAWRRPITVNGADVLVCGDHRYDASINGAMASGRRAAERAVELVRASHAGA